MTNETEMRETFEEEHEFWLGYKPQRFYGMCQDYNDHSSYLWEKWKGRPHNAGVVEIINSLNPDSQDILKETVIDALQALTAIDKALGGHGFATVTSTQVSEPIEWRAPINAPYGIELLVKTYGGAVFLAKRECSVSVNTDENDCDQWQAVSIHPECWTDGCCWESNADEEPSDPVIGWVNLNALLATGQLKVRNKT